MIGDHENPFSYPEAQKDYDELSQRNSDYNTVIQAKRDKRYAVLTIDSKTGKSKADSYYFHLHGILATAIKKAFSKDEIYTAEEALEKVASRRVVHVISMVRSEGVSGNFDKISSISRPILERRDEVLNVLIPNKEKLQQTFSTLEQEIKEKEKILNDIKAEWQKVLRAPQNKINACYLFVENQLVKNKALLNEKFIENYRTQIHRQLPLNREWERVDDLNQLINEIYPKAKEILGIFESLQRLTPSSKDIELQTFKEDIQRLENKIKLLLEREANSLEMVEEKQRGEAEGVLKQLGKVEEGEKAFQDNISALEKQVEGFSKKYQEHLALFTNALKALRQAEPATLAVLKNDAERQIAAAIVGFNQKVQECEAHKNIPLNDELLKNLLNVKGHVLDRVQLIGIEKQLVKEAENWKKGLEESFFKKLTDLEEAVLMAENELSAEMKKPVGLLDRLMKKNKVEAARLKVNKLRTVLEATKKGLTFVRGAETDQLLKVQEKLLNLLLDDSVAFKNDVYAELVINHLKADRQVEIGAAQQIPNNTSSKILHELNKAIFGRHQHFKNQQKARLALETLTVQLNDDKAKDEQSLRQELSKVPKDSPAYRLKSFLILQKSSARLLPLFQKMKERAEQVKGHLNNSDDAMKLKKANEKLAKLNEYKQKINALKNAKIQDADAAQKLLKGLNELQASLRS